jgi:hypothetical protein
MKELYIGMYESSNFDFEVIADSRDKAKKLLLQGLNEHGAKYKLDSSWFYTEDIAILKFNLNKVYVNGLGRI